MEIDIKCAECGNDAPELLEHMFYDGIPQNPNRQWIIVAPLYHSESKKAGYCSPTCATVGMTK